ncbi:UNVERIFIED_CONTAM: hypothetical protein HDU68_006443 [Siphonaria sp. JEL0065]|nr:hypothetical protein HDU68_006443 [Siphonaria sp. JEL0065]
MSLWSAIHSQDVAKLEQLLIASNSNSLQNPNDVNAFGLPLVHAAVRTRNENVVRALLDHHNKGSHKQLKDLDLNINAQEQESGYSPLHVALYNGLLKIALLILHHRPDVDVSLRDNDGNTFFDLLDVSTVSYLAYDWLG